MTARSTTHNTMRIWHRYPGYFLSGIMAVYIITGMAMIFRDTNFLKKEELDNNRFHLLFLWTK